MRGITRRSQTILSVGSGMPYPSLHRLTSPSDALEGIGWVGDSKTRGGGEGGGGPLSTNTFIYCAAHNTLWGEVCAAVSTVLSVSVTFLTCRVLARAFKCNAHYQYTWNESWLSRSLGDHRRRLSPRCGDRAANVEPPRGTNTPLPKPATLGFFIRGSNFQYELTRLSHFTKLFYNPVSSNGTSGFLS